ncbi:hypothetical protein RHGRI_007729 [Rhododendron griersonianum]|uniref:Uncharacterized protein n=1 Tax=Rhododendron griersonianum TaxID=479676 RepID=A0AAV6KXP6_9ERIC|nr:hypothetical protein RHGRI_007729 [Rhododendron griersonianum]
MASTLSIFRSMVFEPTSLARRQRGRWEAGEGDRWWSAKRGGAEEWWRPRKEAEKCQSCSEEGGRRKKKII